MQLDTFFDIHNSWREPETGCMTGGAVIQEVYRQIKHRSGRPDIPVPLQNTVYVPISTYHEWSPGHKVQHWSYRPEEMMFISSEYLMVLGRECGPGGIDAVVELRLLYRNPETNLFFHSDQGCVPLELALEDNWGLEQAEYFAGREGKLDISEHVMVGRHKWKSIHEDQGLYTGYREVVIGNVRMRLHLYTPTLVDRLVGMTTYAKTQAL